MQRGRCTLTRGDWWLRYQLEEHRESQEAIERAHSVKLDEMEAEHDAKAFDMALAMAEEETAPLKEEIASLTAALRQREAELAGGQSSAESTAEASRRITELENALTKQVGARLFANRRVHTEHL